MSLIEVTLLVIAIIFVIIVIILQIISFVKTRRKIGQLEGFFPKDSDYEIKHSSITQSVLFSSSDLELGKFLSNPPERHVVEKIPVVIDKEEDTEENDDANDRFEEIDVPEEYYDVDLILVRSKMSQPFFEVVNETNAYLCKNVGTSADFALIQDICERKINHLDNQISSTINVPLYLGLGGTFLGIIVGVFGIAFNVGSLFEESNMAPLMNLLIGVGAAMLASFAGLGFMVWNSSRTYKGALAVCEKKKDEYYDFIRRELMPVLSSSMASSLNSLKGVLGEFVGKFGHNLEAYANSAELLNDNIEKQHLLLVEVNKMRQLEVSTEMAQSLANLKSASDSIAIFKDYQEQLNGTIENVDSVVEKIDGIITSFDDFATALKTVTRNQAETTELHNQFRTAIEKHFPIESDARELWRKQFDELTSDAQSITEELNNQLKASTEYIKAFVNDNKKAFESLTQLENVLSSLEQYTQVQAECYRDFKQSIEDLKTSQNTAQAENAKLTKDLLGAVKDMTSAIKTLKS